MTNKDLNLLIPAVNEDFRMYVFSHIQFQGLNRLKFTWFKRLVVTWAKESFSVQHKSFIRSADHDLGLGHRQHVCEIGERND